MLIAKRKGYHVFVKRNDSRQRRLGSCLVLEPWTVDNESVELFAFVLRDSGRVSSVLPIVRLSSLHLCSADTLAQKYRSSTGLFPCLTCMITLSVSLLCVQQQLEQVIDGSVHRGTLFTIETTFPTLQGHFSAATTLNSTVAVR